MHLLAVALTCALTAASPLQSRPDLSGIWVFNQEKTMQPGPDGKVVLAAMLGERVVVQQTGTAVTLRITFQGDVVVAVYDLTGAESKNVSPGDITVLSRASWKGDRLVVDSTSESTNDGKPVTVRTSRVMWIDKAGDLIVERTGTPASVVTPSRSVYTRMPQK
ncbi:MAG: hypothetical protein H0W53_19480 [Acidobacteria bacterium]|nr:hypothetical protein [Acidobacteriota bacterium]